MFRLPSSGHLVPSDGDQVNEANEPHRMLLVAMRAFSDSRLFPGFEPMLQISVVIASDDVLLAAPPTRP